MLNLLDRAREGTSNTRDLGREKVRHADEHFLFGGLFHRPQRRETISAKSALDTVRIYRSGNLTKIDRGLTFFAGEADTRNNVTNGISLTFLGQLRIKLLDT